MVFIIENLKWKLKLIFSPIYPFTDAVWKLPIANFYLSLPLNLLSFKEEGRGGKCGLVACGFLPLFSSDVFSLIKCI